jgi:hypothetical protein
MEVEGEHTLLQVWGKLNLTLLKKMEVEHFISETESTHKFNFLNFELRCNVQLTCIVAIVTNSWIKKKAHPKCFIGFWINSIIWFCILSSKSLILYKLCKQIWQFLTSYTPFKLSHSKNKVYIRCCCRLPNPKQNLCYPHILYKILLISLSF